MGNFSYTKLNQNGLQSELFERTVNGVTEYAYVYTGTQPYSIRDMFEDVAQLFGNASQYSFAIYNAKTLSKEVGDKELTFVGHSLGGGEAVAASMATGRAAITFNSAALSKATKNKYRLKDGSKVTNYRAIGTLIGIGGWFVGGDIVNNLQQKVGMKLPGKTIEVPMGPIPTHAISDFLKFKLPEP